MAKPAQFPFLRQDQEYVIFSIGSLDLFVNIHISDTVLAWDVIFL